MNIANVMMAVLRESNPQTETQVSGQTETIAKEGELIAGAASAGDKAPTVVTEEKPHREKVDLSEKAIPGIEDSLKDAISQALGAGEDAIKREAQELRFAKLVARDFAANFDVVEQIFVAAQNAEAQLSRIPLTMARYVQRLFAKIPNPKDRQEKAVAKFGVMVTNAAYELLEVSEVPESVGVRPDGSQKTSLTDRLQSFPRGVYWLKLVGEARAALSAGQWDKDGKELAAPIDLLATNSGKDDGDYIIATSRDVSKQVSIARARKRKAQADTRAATEIAPPNGETSEGGQGTQPVRLAQDLPAIVAASHNKLAQEIDAFRGKADKESKYATFSGKEKDPLAVNVAQALNLAAMMLHGLRYGAIDSHDLDAVALVLHNRQKLKENGKADDDDTDELEHDLPAPALDDEGDEAPSASVND